MPTSRIDVHQHLWPDTFIDALRRRTTPPFLSGWTLYTSTEAPYTVDPRDHDAALRLAEEPAGTEIVLAFSSPLGIEALDPDDAAPLLDAWHTGVRALGSPFSAWAVITDLEPDLSVLDGPVAGLQLPAHHFGTPEAIGAIATVLQRCTEIGKPVFVHPGPAAGDTEAQWWAAVVGYTAQLQSAWWAWHTAGRAIAPGLRICFAAGGGLAALHHERYTSRGGGTYRPDPAVFVDTSSYGSQGIDHLSRVLGIDPIVLGSDRPYAQPLDPNLGEAAWRAISLANPQHLLKGIHP